MKEALIETLTHRWSGQFQSIAVPSGVSAQPIGNMETLQGAWNRIQAIRNILEAEPGFVAEEREGTYRTLIAAIEGGVGPAPEPRSKSSGFSNHGYGECFAYVRVESFDGRIIGQSRSCTFQMPHELSRLVYESGMELGHADDLLFGRQNSGMQSGTVGILTSDLVTRQAYYLQPAILALIPFASRAASY